MDAGKIPVWAYGAGAAVVALALVARRQGGASVATVGPVANPNDAANLQARVSGFNQLAAFAGKTVDQGTQLAQINAQERSSEAQSSAAQSVALINAETERARIAAAAATSAKQSSDQLAAQRSAGKASVVNNVVSTVGKVVGSVFHFLKP